jgi:hypothetical protein
MRFPESGHDERRESRNAHELSTVKRPNRQPGVMWPVFNPPLFSLADRVEQIVRAFIMLSSAATNRIKGRD